MPKFPHIRQKDAMDCGPSCLAMVAAHYGCHLDLAVLRERCFLAKDGVSLLGLSRAAEQIARHNCEKFFTLIISVLVFVEKIFLSKRLVIKLNLTIFAV